VVCLWPVSPLKEDLVTGSYHSVSLGVGCIDMTDDIGGSILI
jgi:hypothetical protein